MLFEVQPEVKLKADRAHYGKFLLQKLANNLNQESLSHRNNYYELLVLKKKSSVSQLKKQIHTLSFERLGVSQKMENAFDVILKKIELEQPSDAMKYIYFFDFLELPKII